MKIIEWNNVEELPPADGMADCDNAEEVLRVVDNQLKKFDLEVIVLDLGSDTICWRIERRMK